MFDREGEDGLRVQPMLAALSLGLVGLAVGLDVLGLAVAQPASFELAAWDIAAGLAAGLAAGFAAVLELRRIAAHAGAFRRGLAALLLQGGAVCLLSLSLVLRSFGPLPSPPAIGLSAVGLALLLLARWVAGRFSRSARPRGPEA